MESELVRVLVTGLILSISKSSPENNFINPYVPESYDSVAGGYGSGTQLHIGTESGYQYPDLGGRRKRIRIANVKRGILTGTIVRGISTTLHSAKQGYCLSSPMTLVIDLDVSITYYYLST